MLADLRGDLRGEGALGGAEVADEARVFGVGGVRVHVAVRLEALEERPDVVEGGVRERARLRVVVAPQRAPSSAPNTSRATRFFSSSSGMVGSYGMGLCSCERYYMKTGAGSIVPIASFIHLPIDNAPNLIRLQHVEVHHLVAIVIISLPMESYGGFDCAVICNFGIRDHPARAVRDR